MTRRWKWKESLPWKKDALRKILVTGVASLLLALLYGIIFRFSAQDAGQSGSLSQSVSEKCVELMNALSGSGWSRMEMAGLAEQIEHPIRKLAHFSEYACMGVLVYTLWSQWLCQGRRLRWLTVGWVFLSAAGDEFHQYFVPGRYASFADVLLDTCGGTFGMFFCVCVVALYRRHLARKDKPAGVS